jgi:tetratricopeptide (TPR) repeat protein
MKPILAAVLASLLPVLTLAQANPRAPQLMAGENGGERKPLGLASADIRVVIAGSIAETTMTLTFRNDTARVLEGELSFPLPEGATISGFGLDVNGSLVDGVPVEKDKARVTYEKETRKRIDPGLVEQAVGNNFRTRVYPIPANGKRTIKVQYVSEVAETNDGATYRLPLGWGEAVDSVSIAIEVSRLPGAGGVARLPEVTRWFSTLTPEVNPTLIFDVRDDRFIAQKTLKDVKFAEDLEITIPKMDGASKSIVERRIKGATMEELLGNHVDPSREEFYFVINDTPPAFKVGQLEQKPSRIGVMWDASLSRLSADKSREIAVLKRLVAGMGNGSIDLVAFRNEPDVPVTFAVHDGTCDELFKAIDALVYDGGTNLNLLPVNKHDANLAYWVLCTDGIADLGPEMPAKLDTRVYVLSNDAKSNHALLRRIGAESGGAYFNLQRVSDNDAVNSIGQEPFMLMGVDYDKNEIAEVYPRGSQPANGRVAVSGRLLAPEAKVTLKYGARGLVTHKVEVTLKQSGAKGTGLIPRFWAEQKVADLSSDVEGNADALSAVGREFNLVTPNTSLLVLETVEQYLQYKIVPPKTYQVVYDQFMQRIEQQKTEVAQSREQRIQQVLALWDQRVKWWEKTYEYPKDLKVVEAEAKGAAGGTAPAAGFDRAPDLSLAATTRPQLRAGLQSAAAASDTPAPAPPVHSPEPQQGAELRLRQMETARGEGLDRARSVTNSDGFLPASLGADRAYGRDGTFKKESKPGSEGPTASITIREWDPDVPYLKAMREAGGDAAYGVYLKQRGAFIASPAFYLDCADYLLRNGQKQLGVRVLTNIAELKLENAQLLRIVAHRLNQIGDRDLAINLFEKIKKMRPEEPQSWRDLALALSDRADALRGATGGLSASAGGSGSLLRYSGGGLGRGLSNSAESGKEPPPQPSPGVPEEGEKLNTPYPTIEKIDADYTAALELLDHVVMNHWDRFEEIEVTALMEANRVLASRAMLPTLYKRSDILDHRLIKNLDCDVRIVLTWDADLTDVDLWVTEPSGEKCFYSHNRTTIGGLLSRDFTQGYGPEEYCLRRTMPGTYTIQCNYYGSSQTSLVGPCTVQATVITHFGRPDEKRQALTVRVTTPKDVVEIGKVELK